MLVGKRKVIHFSELLWVFWGFFCVCVFVFLFVLPFTDISKTVIME